jgi:hypothetical protein
VNEFESYGSFIYLFVLILLAIAFIRRLAKRVEPKPNADVQLDNAVDLMKKSINDLQPRPATEAESWNPDIVSARLKISAAPDAKQKLKSWFGGSPSLPKGTDWPQLDGKPMYFVAQIHCGDLPREMWFGTGPRTGWLVFFLSAKWPFKVSVLHTEQPGYVVQGPPQCEAEWFRKFRLDTVVSRTPRWPVEILQHRSGMPELMSSCRLGEDKSLMPDPKKDVPLDLRQPVLQPFDWASAEALLTPYRNSMQRRVESSRREQENFGPARKNDRDRKDIAEEILSKMAATLKVFKGRDPDAPLTVDDWLPVSVDMFYWKWELDRVRSLSAAKGRRYQRPENRDGYANFRNRIERNGPRTLRDGMTQLMEMREFIQGEVQRYEQRMNTAPPAEVDREEKEKFISDVDGLVDDMRAVAAKTPFSKETADPFLARMCDLIEGASSVESARERIERVLLTPSKKTDFYNAVYRQHAFDLAAKAYTGVPDSIPEPMRSYYKKLFEFHAQYEVCAMGNEPHGFAGRPEPDEIVLLELRSSYLLKWIWGDLYTLVFWIKGKDLAHGRFDRVRLQITN